MVNLRFVRNLDDTVMRELDERYRIELAGQGISPRMLTRRVIQHVALEGVRNALGRYSSPDHLPGQGPYDHSQTRLGAVRPAVRARKLTRQASCRGVVEDAVQSVGAV
jgi:hypothetical protein